MNYTDFMDSPLGPLIIRATQAAINQVEFAAYSDATTHANSITERCKQQLLEYFDGTRQMFELPLDPQGTEFQKSIWKCLITIPYGAAVSYRDIADMVNNRKAVRAVGAANGKNPIAIIIPCHRVIGANRSLTGYASGLERKAWLLNHEGIAYKDKQQDNSKNCQADLFAT